MIGASVENSADGPASSRRIARDTIYNLIGQGAPLLVALFAIPILIKGLGTDRFGILTLAWMFVGYFSIFDLGLGRALTQLVAKRIGSERENEIPALVWTAHAIMCVLGLSGALFAMSVTVPVVHGVLKIPSAIVAETITSFYILSALVPVVILTSGLRGVLEAYHCFGLINAVRVPMGVFTFVGPLLVLPWSISLVPVILSLAVVRISVLIAYYCCCRRVHPTIWRRARVESSYVKPLLGFGGWMTVSNIIGPIMVSMDRFVIGAVLSTSAVAYYSTPYELVTKLLVIPSALVGVLFPTFAKTYGSDPAKAALYYKRSIGFIILALLPIVVVLALFAQKGLTLWVGAEFAKNSYRVLQWLSLGVLMNGIALVPFTFLQGVGKPDVTAKLHFVELPLYGVMLVVLLDKFGIIGAAAAWTVRVMIDAVVLQCIAYKFKKGFR